MGNKDFHNKPYDDGTITKLRIFELYTEEWLPVFLSPEKPKFDEIHIFDFFSGPGTDSNGVHGSPLRILNQLRRYHKNPMAGWDKVRIVVHFFDKDPGKIEQLESIIRSSEWEIPGVSIDPELLIFSEALAKHGSVLMSPRVAKLLIIDQYGVDEVSDAVFKKLISFPITDFIFFLSSSTLHRFRDHPAIKQKIDRPEDSYDVHRAAINYYRELVPTDVTIYLAPFSIKKRSNIYGLIFGSQHPLGIHKFLQVAWANDEIAGEANFDIERENIGPGEGLFNFEIMRPNKVRGFEKDLEDTLRSGAMKTEADVIRFCIEAGMTCQHCSTVLKRLKTEKIIDLNFWVPDVRNIKTPRPIKLIH
jgi:three-Cys-motif partner protein